MIPAMLLRGHERPSFASLAVAVVTAVRPECRGNAPVDLALIATAARDHVVRDDAPRGRTWVAGDVPEGATVWVQADRRWRAMVRVGGGL